MICNNCVYISHLKKLIEKAGQRGCCTYCNNDTTVIDEKSFFPFLEDRFKDAYRNIEELSEYEHAMIFELGSNDLYVYDCYTCIIDSFDFGCEEAREAFYDWLSDDLKQERNGKEKKYFFDNGTTEFNMHERDWHRFIEQIQHGYRFFNEDAKIFLDGIFFFIDRDTEEQLTTQIGLAGNLYRARISNESSDIEKITKSPQQELGAPPNVIATNQRMTPQGIGAMYCALERSTCLSELRPIAGDFVISGKFRPTRNLKFFDLNKLETMETVIPDFFEVNYRSTLHAHIFIKGLIEKLSKPKGRKDDLAYLSTQVLFEYFRLKFGARLDGLAYPSVQTNRTGTNIVFFPSPCLVKEARIDSTLGFNSSMDIHELNKLEFIENSLNFHRITGVTTSQKTYSALRDANLTPLERKRFGSLNFEM